MGYRTLEISTSCEIHIKEGQLEVTSDAGVASVSLMTLDEKYLPTAIILPFEGHARQSKLMHAQVYRSSDIYLDL